MGDRTTAQSVTIVGGGLAGCEAALQLADRGWHVTLREMRPQRSTPAHRTGSLAEIVCSNSFKSERPDTPAGALKLELELLSCRLLPLAREARVPAGAALGLDRELFAELVHRAIAAQPRIVVVREEASTLPPERPCLVATGPLTSPALERDLAERLGAEALYFYDAIAPSVLLDSVDTAVAFRAARYGKGGDDYLNCPLDRPQYEAFVDALLAAERAPLHDFDQAHYFPGCMPIEAIAAGGRESLRFGPMRPVGLRDPRSAKRPYAVVQLRQETRDGTLYGLVGFQTQLRHGEQLRIFRQIPGLNGAEFARLGSLHRNTFLDSPRHLNPDLSWRRDNQVWFAGQMIGCEGYVESLSTGLIAALAIDAAARGRRLTPPPVESLLGGLLAYLRTPSQRRLSPMNVNFGLLPPLPHAPRDQTVRREAYTARAVDSMRAWVSRGGDGALSATQAPA